MKEGEYLTQWWKLYDTHMISSTALLLQKSVLTKLITNVSNSKLKLHGEN